GQHRDDLLELGDRSRPSVEQQQRRRIRTDPGLMDEVDIATVDRHLVMRKRVELALMLAPVVACAPVIDEVFQVGQIGAVGPSGIAYLSGQTRARQPLAKIGQHLLRNRDGKLLDRTVRHRLLLLSSVPLLPSGYLRASASLTRSLASLPSKRAPN